MALSPHELLRRDQDAANRYAANASKQRTQQLLERAQIELTQRLAQAEGLGGAGADSFTAAQMRVALEQVRTVLKGLTQNVLGSSLELGKVGASQGVESTLDYIGRAEADFRGIARPLPFDTAQMFDTVARGVNASILRRLGSDPGNPASAGVLGRYGANVFGKFEEAMQQRFIQGKSWNEARADLTAASPFLQGAPAYWTERILRTETMNAHGAASQESLTQVEAVVGAMLKILSATFDHRTGADSYAVHGQIRRPTEAFVSWYGPYMHPPNRPNDREVVVPHNMSWPLPKGLEPKSDGEVAARWAQEGRKGSPPPRPLMSTVDRELIGKQQTKPMADAAPPSPLKPPAEPPARAFSFPEVGTRNEPLPAPGDGIVPPLVFQPPPLNPLSKKLEDAAGSNPGGKYLGSDGVERYVKFYDDPAQAAGEHLANKIYEKLGLGALKSQLFEHEGKVAYASEYVQGAQTISKKLNAKTAAKALDGFAADVLVANWDAVGLTLDNLIITPQGKVMRVDNGGALLSRARAGRKSPAALTNPAAEWSGFFDPKINPAYTRLAATAGVRGPQDMAERVIKSIDKIDKLAKKKGGWSKFVKENAPELKPADHDQIVEMLTTRTDFLRKQRDALKAKLAESNSPTPARRPITEEELAKARDTYEQNQHPAARHFQEKAEYNYVIQSYTGNGYRKMNQALYKPREELEKSHTAAELRSIAEKNEMLNQALLDAKAKGLAVKGVVYRGVAAWPGLAQELESGEFGFSCFASTSPAKHVAESFSGGGYSGVPPFLFRLRQNSAIPIDKVSVNSGEIEALLPPGVRFRVIKTEPWKNGGMIIDAEEIE